MPLVYGATSGIAGDRATLMTPTGGVASDVLDLTTGTSIPDGAYVGQPAIWDGAAWVPLAPSDPLRVDAIGSDTGALQIVVDMLAMFGNIAVNIDGPTGGLAIVVGVSTLTNDEIQIVPGVGLRFFDTSAGAPRQSIVGQFPSEISASLLAALVAYGLATDATNPATVQSVIGYDAAAPVVMTLLAAPHAPGLYMLQRELMRRVTAVTGTLALTQAWSDPSIGATTATGAAGSLVGAPGLVALTTNQAAFFSDGTADITLTWTPTAVTGAPSCDIYGVVTRLP